MRKEKTIKIKVEFDPRGRGDVVLADGRRAFIPIESIIDTIETCVTLGLVINEKKSCHELFQEALIWLMSHGGFEFVPDWS
jgi:hypothetical protein